MKNKRGDKVISVYWFAILFIVAAGIVYMAVLFYGGPYDVREIESKLLASKMADCLSQGGYLNEGVLGWTDFKEDFLEECDVTFNVEEVYGWEEQEQYYLEVGLFEFDKEAVDGKGNKIFNIIEGNVNLKTAPELEEKPRNFYVLDNSENAYVVTILAIVRKTEKNVI
jgi:hypothetical protein